MSAAATSYAIDAGRGGAGPRRPAPQEHEETR
jgi:hypothetical protein